MTREEILAKKPGQELDEFVGKTFGFAPKIKWYAMNKDETAFYMDFDSKSFAENWHNTNITRFPDGIYRTDGGHIVRREIYKRFSEDISAAWEVVEKMRPTHVYEMADFGRNAHKKQQHCAAFHPLEKPRDNERQVRAKTAPEAICKAALLAVMEEEK